MSYVSFSAVKSDYNDYKLQNGSEALFSALIELTSTPKGTHPYDPNYGVGTRQFLFTPNNSNLAATIENDIETAIRNYIPEISDITKVVAMKDYSSTGNNVVYNVKIVISNTVLDFRANNNGTLDYSGSFEVKNVKGL